MRAWTWLVTGTLLLGAGCAGGNVICINGGTDCIEQGSSAEPVSFESEVAPYLRNTCALGGCHDANSEEGGFKTGPGADVACGELYQELKEDRTDVSEGTGPRVESGVNGANSFLVRKATNDIPHDGAGILRDTDAEYTMLVNWINGDQANDCP